MVFKTLDIRQLRAGIPERQETRELSPKLLQPEEFPAKGSTEKEEPQGVRHMPRGEQTEPRIQADCSGWSLQDRV